MAYTSITTLRDDIVEGSIGGSEPTGGQLSVGVRLPESLFSATAAERLMALKQLSDGNITHVSVGDHVSFKGGTGYDGLVRAASLLSMHADLQVHVAVYQLALRHPVLVARQIATIAEMAPGGLEFGVGVGGDDPREYEVCGIDPSTRGARTDDALIALQKLLQGGECTHHGVFFSFNEARIHPVPSPRVPIVIGGRSEKAFRRAGILGDGWLGLWVSAKRFKAAVETISQVAGDAGRGSVDWRHGVAVWCGFGPNPESARGNVASAMEELYRRPFADFERWVPYGSPSEITQFLQPYVDAGCSSITLIPCASSNRAAIAGAIECARLLGCDGR